MARERSRGRLSPRRGREAADASPGIGIEAEFAALLGSGVPGTGDMLASTYDPAGIAQQLVGTLAAQILSGKTLDQAIMLTDILLSNIGPDYTIVWDVPPSAITLEITNPGVSVDQFVFAHAPEFLWDKTMFNVVIQDFSLAQHDHNDAAGGGLIGGSNFAWVLGDNFGQIVNAAWTTILLDRVEETAGTGVTLLTDGIYPTDPGQYEVNASTRWDCEDAADGDFVAVRWQKFNSTSGLWETISGT